MGRKGAPARLKAEAIDPVARVLHLAHVAEVFARIGGAPAARDEVQQREGAALRTAPRKPFWRSPAELLQGLPAVSVWDLFLEAEPAPALTIGPATRSTSRSPSLTTPT